MKKLPTISPIAIPKIRNNTIAPKKYVQTSGNILLYPTLNALLSDTLPLWASQAIEGYKDSKKECMSNQRKKIGIPIIEYLKPDLSNGIKTSKFDNDSIPPTSSRSTNFESPESKSK